MHAHTGHCQISTSFSLYAKHSIYLLLLFCQSVCLALLRIIINLLNYTQSGETCQGVGPISWGLGLAG